MRIYLTTDTHFNHVEAMKKYCSRPDDYENKIIKEFATLKPQDTLIHLGDICIGKDAFIHEQIIEPLSCKKILVKGNHDKKSNHWYMSNGWDFVCDSFTMTRGGKRILFSHMPQAWDGYYDMNIHGHFHNANHRRYEDELKKALNGRQKLIALEYTNYQLVNLDKALEVEE